MSDIYILQSQNNLYLSKSGDWVSGDDSKILFRTQYKDEAINQKVELTVKQPELRVHIAMAQLSDNGKLILQKEQEAVTLQGASTQDAQTVETGTTDEHHKATLENEHTHSINTASSTQNI